MPPTCSGAWAPSQRWIFACSSNFGLAMIAVLWAYEGWQFGTYSAGEVLKPQKTFPKAFLMGSLFLMALYLIAVIAYLVALGPTAATVSDAIAADCGRRRAWARGRENSSPGDHDFHVQRHQQRGAYRAARFLRHGQRQFVFQETRGSASAISNAGGGDRGAGRVVRGAYLRGHLRGTGLRRDIHRMDFLRPWGGGHFSDTPRVERIAHSLPRAGLSVDAADFCNCCRGHRWQRHISGAHAIRSSSATWPCRDL